MNTKENQNIKQKLQWSTYTMEEVSLHRNEEDGWFVYNGSIYNAVSHLKEVKQLKPSTYLAILRVLGTDCTVEMNEIGHSEQAWKAIQLLKIGEVKPE